MARGNLWRNEKRGQALVDAYARKLADKPRKATGAYRYHDRLITGPSWRFPTIWAQWLRQGCAATRLPQDISLCRKRS